MTESHMKESPQTQTIMANDATVEEKKDSIAYNTIRSEPVSSSSKALVVIHWLLFNGESAP